MTQQLLSKFTGDENIELNNNMLQYDNETYLISNIELSQSIRNNFEIRLILLKDKKHKSIILNTKFGTSALLYFDKIKEKLLSNTGKLFYLEELKNV